MHEKNLNHERWLVDRSGGFEGPDHLVDHGMSTDSSPVSVYFRDLKTHLIRHVREYDGVVGCVAWLTDHDILLALSKVRCGLLVQKEDFLRPDAGGWSKYRLKGDYAKLQRAWERRDLPNPLPRASIFGDTHFDPIRCVGMLRTSQSEPTPVLHHKFLVFGDEVPCYGSVVKPRPGSANERRVLDRRAELEAERVKRDALLDFSIGEELDFPRTQDLSSNDPDWVIEQYHSGSSFAPKAVWTGSFNFTSNASRSLENAVFIRDPSVATAYANEFAQVAMLSEPLNWSSKWVCPAWRIGT